MRYEQFKTVTLIAMIGLSLFFTYQLWTYQPTMQALETSENEEEDNENGDDDEFIEEREVWELIEPEQIVLHEANDTYSFVEKGSERFETMINDLQRLDLIQTIDNEDVSELEGIEVVFPDAIPSNYLLSQYEGDQEMIRLNEVDRMFFYSSPDSDNVSIQFASKKADGIVTIHTSLLATDFATMLSGEEESELSAEIAKETDHLEMLLRERLYVTTEPQTVAQKQYMLEPLEVTPINQRLFSSTIEVPRQNQLNGEYVYTDGSRIVTIDGTLMFLNYSYPFVADSSETSSRHIIEAGTSFINENGAWTDEYTLSGWNVRETSETVDFRVQVDGLPVFYRNNDESDSMKFSVSRAGTQVTNLQRPLFRLNSLYQEYDKQVPSGKAAVSRIKQANETEWDESVTNVQLGYRAIIANRSNVELVPTWYYESGGEWKRVPFDEEAPS
ncbi:two-component system activity regulator YycH [Bacillus sp. JCM 19041]|uniref:YycH family regulatory protein n=1 Tax=Bacillus sp. JCM 19041 TaxID=1460637 RepID=UPI0006D0A5E2